MTGVMFGDKHSFYDLGLILTHKNIGYPATRTNYLTIEGSNGDIDLSDVLSNELTYDDRILSFEFVVAEPIEKFDEIRSMLGGYLQGKKMKIVLDSDKSNYYIGRCTVNEFQEDKSIGKITVDVKANPFKYERVHEVYSFTSSGTYKLYMPEYLKDIRNFEIHSLKSPKSATVSVNGKSISIPSTVNGTEWNKMNDVVLYKKINTFEFTSSRTESITVEFSYEIGVI